MNVTRRNLIGAMVAGAATALAADAEQAATLSPLALLYDATQCVGCQACVAACGEANGMAREGTFAAQPPVCGLSDRSLSAIELYQAPGGTESSFVKRQCMHCSDPACVASCMFGALHKDPSTGIVRWNSSLCVGCRYCEIACPFHVPRFQWSSFNPRIVKCEMCATRLAAGTEPACTSVCPARAVVFGSRKELLAAARKRIAQSPGKYFENRVYGERDGGGTQALYLSRVAFDKIGLPRLGTESIPARYMKWQKRVYAYLAAPSAVYALLVSVLGVRWREHRMHQFAEEESTGLRSQL